MDPKELPILQRVRHFVQSFMPEQRYRLFQPSNNLHITRAHFSIVFERCRRWYDPRQAHWATET
jgi:hypothetical protein